MARIKSLFWDTWNIDHIARHGVVKEEVSEALLDKDAHWSETYSQRKRVVGKTEKDRALTIILAEKNKNSLYVVTARPASRKERKLYDKAKQNS